jgi:hypothetical protein
MNSPTTIEFERVLTMSSAYIASLNKLIATQSPRPQPLSLRQRFLEWYRSVPEFARNRRFAMLEIEMALKTQGKWISPVLLDLVGALPDNITGTGCLPRIRISIILTVGLSERLLLKRIAVACPSRS